MEGNKEGSGFSLEGTTPAERPVTQEKTFANQEANQITDRPLPPDPGAEPTAVGETIHTEFTRVEPIAPIPDEQILDDELFGSADNLTGLEERLRISMESRGRE